MGIVSLNVCLESLTSCDADTDVPVDSENLFFPVGEISFKLPFDHFPASVVELNLMF